MFHDSKSILFIIHYSLFQQTSFGHNIFLTKLVESRRDILVKHGITFALVRSPHLFLQSASLALLSGFRYCPTLFMKTDFLFYFFPEMVFFVSINELYHSSWWFYGIRKSLNVMLETSIYSRTNQLDSQYQLRIGV